MRTSLRLVLALALLAASVPVLEGCRTPPGQDDLVRPGGSTPEGESPEGELPDDERERLRSAGEESQELGTTGPESPLVENWFLEAAAGATDEVGDPGTAFGSLGANHGGPFPGLEESGLGYQAGVNIAKREGQRFDLQLSTGFIYRETGLVGRGLGGALLLDYVRPREDTDLFGFRGIAGVDLTEKHHLGARVVVPLNSDREDDPVVEGDRQKVLLRTDVIWGYELTDNLATELHVGHLEGSADAFVFGARGGITVLPQVALEPAFEVTPDGDYAASVSIVYEFSGQRRPALVTRYSPLGDSDYTPFRLRGFHELILETRR